MMSLILSFLIRSLTLYVLLLYTSTYTYYRGGSLKSVTQLLLALRFYARFSILPVSQHLLHVGQLKQYLKLLLLYVQITLTCMRILKKCTKVLKRCTK
jgi:hypothetical protein